MKKILAPTLVPLLCEIAFAETVPSADNPEQAHADSFKKRFAADLRHPAESEARLNKWFRDDKFGVFIHFGAYSPLAGQYKGNSDGPPYAERAMMTYRIPLKEYREEVVYQFNPQEFDADEWARIFKASGRRYVVITSKHHDRFALFKSGVTDYNVLDGSPFRRDIIKELGQACHRHGLKFGVYYSRAFDWREPGAPFPVRPAWGDASLSKDGKTLHLHVMKWPADGKLVVEGIPAQATNASFLSPKAPQRRPRCRPVRKLTHSHPAHTTHRSERHGHQGDFGRKLTLPVNHKTSISRKFPAHALLESGARAPCLGCRRVRPVPDMERFKQPPAGFFQSPREGASQCSRCGRAPRDRSKQSHPEIHNLVVFSI
jgi:hypothetical protein